MKNVARQAKRRRTFRRLPLSLTLSGAVLVLTLGGVSFSSTPTDEAWPSPEAETNQRIQALIVKRGGLLATGKKWVDISLADAVRQALRDNLGLKLSELRKRYSGQSLIQAKSVFDAVMTASAGYSRSETYERTLTDRKFFSGTTTCNSTDCPGETAANLAKPIYRVLKDDRVSYLRYNKEKPEGYYNYTIKASEAQTTGPTKTRNIGFGLSKSLPWGATMSVNESSTRRKTTYTANADTPTPVWGEYDRPWTSSISTTVAAPVPWAKNFGADSQLEIGVRQASQSLDLAVLDVLSEMDGVILGVELAWWDLVGKSQNLAVAMGVRENLALLAEKTASLYEARRVTEYETLQVAADLSRVQTEENAAWNAYITASNALNAYLNFDENILFAPVGYSAAVDGGEIDLDKAIERGMRDEVRLRMEAIRLAKSSLDLSGSKAQAKPDLSLSGTATASQSRSVYGYSEYVESLRRLTHPDKVSLTGSITYRYPWGNEAVKANMAYAGSIKKGRESAMRVLKNQVMREIKDAYALRLSAQAQVAISRRNMNLAENLYDKAEGMQTARKVTEYEILERSTDLLNARKRFVSARVEARKAMSRFLAAIGALRDKYADAPAMESTEMGMQTQAHLADGSGEKGGVKQ